MARKVFFSFHYVPDNWRASQVRNIGVIEGNQAVSDNKWEEVTSGGEAAIKDWISSELNGKSCALVLIGSNTAGRKWINYEIATAWNAGKGVAGIYVHNLKDSAGATSTKGANPFDSLTYGTAKLSTVVPVFNPPGSTSTDVYKWIADNIEAIVEQAIANRAKY